MVDVTQSEAIIGTYNALASPTMAYPVGATPLEDASGNKANASAVATLAAATGKTTYISGFSVTGSGATTALPVTVTVVGPTTTLIYTYTFIAGVLLANQPLLINFTIPIPAAATNTAIVVTCPASGTGGTNNTVTAYGFRV
jgi:hypothetical protein